MALPLLCLGAARSPRLIAPTFSFPDFISPPFSTHPANPSLPSAPPPADFLLFSMDLRHPSSRIILVVFFTSPSILLIILVSLSLHRLLFFPFSAILVSYYLNFLCVIFYSLINFFYIHPVFTIFSFSFSLPYFLFLILFIPYFLLLPFPSLLPILTNPLHLPSTAPLPLTLIHFPLFALTSHSSPSSLSLHSHSFHYSLFSFSIFMPPFPHYPVSLFSFLFISSSHFFLFPLFQYFSPSFHWLSLFSSFSLLAFFHSLLPHSFLTPFLSGSPFLVLTYSSSVSFSP